MATITVQKQLSGTTIKSVATVTEKSRSGTSVVLNLTFKTNLVSDSGYIGTGYDIVGTITAYGISKSVTLKSTSSSWNDTSVHTTTSTMSITVPASTTSISIGYKIKHDGETATGTSTTLTLSKVMASVSSATAFSDTTNPTMYFSNPGGYKIRPYLNIYDKSGGTRLLQLRPDGMGTTGASLSSPYVWSLTDGQRNQIRNVLGVATTAYVAVGLETYSGSTYLGYSSKGVTFTNVLAPPIFTDFSYEDIGGVTIDENLTTLDLTGNNNQRIIKSYSKLKISISEPAEAQKGATMSHYSINGTKYTYANDFEVEIDKWSTEKITIYAVDSRGISKEVSKTCDLVNYSPLSKGTISVKREGNIGNQTILSYDGSFWNNNFGTEEVQAIDNTLQASYKFRKTSDSSYTDGTTTINPTSSENKFNFEDYILGDSPENGFEINDSYEIVVNVKDKLSEITYSSILGSGIPALAIYKNNVAIHGKYDKELGGAQIYGDLFFNKIKMVEPNMMTATISQTQSFEAGTATTKINLNSAVSVGTKLTLSNGAIKIGAGIRKVLVGGEIRLSNDNTTSNGIYNIYIHNNGTSVACGRNGPITPGTVIGLSAPLRLIEVKEGDVIDLSFYKTSNYLASAYPNYGGTYLTVIAVG